MQITLQPQTDSTRADEACASRDGAAHQLQAALLSRLVDELAHGVLVVNPECWILHANLAAQRELYSRSVLSSQFGRVSAILAENQAALELSVKEAARGRRGLIDLKIDNGIYSVAVIPLNRDGADRCESLALFLPRSEVNDCGVFAAFARSQNLTRTEQQVLKHLCRCLSTPEIAIEMGIAVSTVRSHVRSLCVKTRSSGARELVSRVALLAPIAAPQAAGPRFVRPASSEPQPLPGRPTRPLPSEVMH